MSRNKPSDMPHIDDVLELAKILRKDGDQVLNGTSKLSLSTKLLQNLNDAFTLIIDESKELECSFHVCNSSEIDIFCDLKFLHDFVQKTIWLKIINTNFDRKLSTDITKFRHLRYLELQKVCIELINGIQSVRGQLETICCTGGGGVGTIGRLLAACGGDDGVGFIWASLKRLALPYNGLGRLDKSLELAPWLQTLDLSHNYISNATELNCLPSLKHVNLGYNKLENVPTFNKLSCRNLQVLILKNNYIENIDQLQGLDFLSELDLSFNCLSDHSLLWPIEVMTALSWLNLTGNPLSYHIRHRILTTKYLHASLAENKFILDHQPLSKSEKSIVSENRLFTIRSSLLSKYNSNSPINSITSHTTVETRDNLTVSQNSEMTQNNLTASISKIQKITNLKEVNIADNIDDDDNNIDNVNQLAVSCNIEMSLDHLETKKKILALREEFGGENWLINHGGSFVQDIMGIERTATNLNVDSPSIASDILSINQSYTLPNILNTNNELSDNKCNDDSVMTVNNTEIKSKIDELIDDNKHSSINEIELNSEKNINMFICDDPDEESAESFLVRKMKNSECNEMEELFLIITPDNIKERDPITGKIKYRWSIDSILSCLMRRRELTMIDFMFDTMRRDRQCRTYYTESTSDATKIINTVNNSMKIRPLMLNVFKCMKCSTHFSHDCDYMLAASTTTNPQSKSPICPSCKSTLVIQTTDELLSSTDDDNTKKIEKKFNTTSAKDNEIITSLQHSASQSSIGGTEDGAMSITTTVMYSDSQHPAQACCTATSLDDSRESTPSTSTNLKKCESDIEILSNPSQSSIEVLDDGSKFGVISNEKRLSEERRITIAPINLQTIPDTTPIMTGLTESSSSGSLTDSICTTYENKIIKTSMISLKSQEHVDLHLKQSEHGEKIKDPIYTPVSNLTSMLGDLLQSMKIGSDRELPLKSNDESNLYYSNMQYSYTNFTSVDHRIKLHLILNIFELENEELILFLRCDILMHNQSVPFPGCLVLSSSKIYVLRIIGIEGDDPQQWLQNETSWTIDRLRTFAPLPFKQGLIVNLQLPNKLNDEPINFIFICIIQDFQRTSNLFFYLADLSLPDNCDITFSIPEQCTTSIHNLMISSNHYRNDDAVRIFALFSSASLQLGMHLIELHIGGIVVTTSSLILIDDKIHWIMSQSNLTPTKLTEQAISNLIEVIIDEFSVVLNFFDEIAGIEQLWKLTFVSSGAVNTLINAIQSPWEELFSVPLQIINKISQDNINDKS